jgi:hypothetical protein
MYQYEYLTGFYCLRSLTILQSAVHLVRYASAEVRPRSVTCGNHVGHSVSAHLIQALPRAARAPRIYSCAYIYEKCVRTSNWNVPRDARRPGEVCPHRRMELAGSSLTPEED